MEPRGPTDADGDLGSPERRIAVHAPTGRDAELAREILARLGYQVSVVRTLGELSEAIVDGCGLCVLAAEALVGDSFDRLLQVVRTQPAWSDVPFIVFTRDDPQQSQAVDRLASFGNVLVVERPVRIASLSSLVRSALRARVRQYQARDMLERLADLDRKKNHFMAVLGHELRNPLAAIATAGQLLALIDEPRLERPRKVIERQTQNLTQMLDDLLDVSRAMAGKVRLRQDELDLNDIADRAVSTVEESLRRRNHVLEYRRANHAVMVRGDAVRLEQVLVNLLSNAIKYTPDAGRIKLTLSVGHDHAEVCVSDDGVGLAPEMQGAIFEAFTQVDGSLDRSQGGLGLGLPLVRSLVELHGGKVWATSDGLGRGCRFEVRLPLAVGVRRRATSSTPDEAGQVGRCLDVLVVEDNPDLRSSLRDLLESWGHRVSLAADGHQAVAVASASPPDVALIDIGLPGLDGFGVARQLRAVLGRDIAMHAMTGYGNDDVRGQAELAGFDDFLVKPLDPKQLRRILAGA